MRFGIAFLFLITASGVFADQLRFESGDKRTALIELYTSEGCSSCPPAEAWLSKLKSNPGLWKDFVPLAFHVDYWDRLGWRDRFAAGAWTQRQNDYASLLNGESVYTPQFIVNATEWRNWFRNEGLPKADARGGILSAATTHGEKFTISYRGFTAADLEAHVALLGCGINSRIGGGENNGRQLQHDFVVLDHRMSSMTRDAKVARANITVERNAQDVPQKAIAIWITQANRLEPLQATGGWLGKIASASQPE